MLQQIGVRFLTAVCSIERTGLLLLCHFVVDVNFLSRSLFFRKKANLDLGETGEFNQRRIYDDQNTFDLLRVISEVLG